MRLERRGQGQAAGQVWGTVTDLQRCSVHDGPGIRTTVFLKGCPLVCPWCHNPETQRPDPELLVDAQRCIGCGECRRACLVAAIPDDGPEGLDRVRCDGCGRCAEACPSQAIVLSGRRVSASEVAEIVARDREFFRASGGGVTLSGGEPALQPAFAEAILAACRGAGIATAIETAGWCAPASLARLLALSDLVFLDIKTLDPEVHRRVLGRSLDPVRASARLIARSGAPLVVRIPLVPGFNDGEKTLRTLLAFVAELTSRVEFLPYHRMAEAKYRRLGRPCPAAGTPEPSPECLHRAVALAVSAGLSPEP